MIKTLFIYGFGGSPDSNFCKLLKKWLPNNQYEVICYEYPQEDCGKAIEFLEGVIEREGVDLVVGTSLGSFITLALTTDKKRFVINPCMKPSDELPKLKPRPDHPEDIEASAEMIATYKAFEPRVNRREKRTYKVNGIFATEDELFGLKYMKRFMWKYGSAWVNPNGGHHGSEEAMPTIVRAIQDFMSPDWEETKGHTKVKLCGPGRPRKPKGGEEEMPF